MRDVTMTRCKCLELAFSRYRATGICKFHTACTGDACCQVREVELDVVTAFVVLLANIVESDPELPGHERKRTFTSSR